MDNINDAQKFIEASKKCGKCGCKYSSAREASDCVTRKHGLVRCYFCFKVFKSTEHLFIHYGRCHSQSTQADSLLCGFCSKVIPYKSVSTHVISHHLFEKKNGTMSGSSKGTGPMPTDGHESESEPEPDPEPQLEPKPKSSKAKAKSIKKTSKVTGQNETDDPAAPTLTLPQLRTAVKNCGQCGLKFSSAALASACIAKHHLLRCYLCLKLVADTEELFKHFRLAHEDGNGKNPGSITCSFCPLTVKYKSVSCHIISMHLVDNLDSDGAEAEAEAEVDPAEHPEPEPEALADFLDAVKTCSVCNKKHSSAIEGAGCFSGHGNGSVKCYQCWRSLPNTAELFNHYKADHAGVQVGRKKIAIGKVACCFCRKLLSYKSVSTHVIGDHMQQVDGENGNEDENEKAEVKAEVKVKVKAEVKVKPKFKEEKAEGGMRLRSSKRQKLG